MKYLIPLLFLLLTLFTPAHAKRLHKEKWYQEKYCQGQVEVRLPDGTRVDCLTDTHAIEYDFANKWAEAPIVSNSGWDGSVFQVERYLDKILKDPDSFDAIEWGKVVKTSAGFIVRCKYRAKNSYGGYVIEHKLFTLDKNGNVTGVANWQ